MIWILALLGLGGVALAKWIKKVKGKKFAVLGERTAGKTALINFLIGGTFSQEHAQTRYAKKTDSNHFELKDLELEIEESIDVPGSNYHYGQWEDITKKADIVLYLLRADKLKADDKLTEERVKKDMDQIGRWMRDTSKEYPLFIIGTHCDCTDPDFTKLPENKKGDYVDEMRSMPIFRDIVRRGGGNAKVRVAFGSLKSKESTEALVYDVIYQVVHHEE